MSRLKIFIIFLITAFLFGCNSPKPKNDQGQNLAVKSADMKGTLTINGAFALSPLIEKMSDQFMKLYPDVKIEVKRSVTGEGIADLLSGKCQIAMISRPLTDEELNAGIRTFPITKDGVAPVVNQKNPSIEKILGQGLSPDEFMAIFTSEKQLLWGDVLGNNSRDKIRVYTRADESGAAEIWAGFIFKRPSDLKGTRVTADDEMIKKIQDDPLAIGFCNFSYAFDTAGERKKDIQIVPTDLDFDNTIDRVEIPFRNLEEAHRSIWLGFFPDQLCRELTLGTMGKPTNPVVIGFLTYVLTVGQPIIEKSGYCKLNNVYVQYGLDLLK